MITLLSPAKTLDYESPLTTDSYSIPDYLAKQQEVQKQHQQNANLVQRNALLKADISDLTIGLEAVEERARNELGLIKRGETFYRILPSEDD